MTWQRLRAKYPSDFTVTAEQVAAWHDFQAKECELKKNWSAAAFHLEHLLSIRSGDQSVAERLARAKSNLIARH